MEKTILSATILSVLLAMGTMVVPANADLAPAIPDTIKTFSGMIEGIDPSQRVVSIQSEEERGEMRLFAFSDPDVVKGLSKGDHVMVELDAHGMAKRIIRAFPDQKDMSNSK